ncbi:MAG: hypothetical protein M3301_01680 [Chloroflexota bacterium]|nr:hypothetical protein [Chloroflexota bacterium]
MSTAVVTRTGNQSAPFWSRPRAANCADPARTMTLMATVSASESPTFRDVNP